MTVVNRHPAVAVAAVASASAPRLLDGTAVREGMDIRCVRSLRAARLGEVLRVVGGWLPDGGVDVPCRRMTTTRRGASADGEVRLSADELRGAFRPARLGTLSEQSNSHYAQRPVVVLLNHGPKAGRTWDPLYTALGLGAEANVTLVANRSTLRAAHQSLTDVLKASLPQVPPVWNALVAALAVS